MDVNTAFGAVLGLSLAVNGWFLKEAWAEIKSLRQSRHEHAQKLTEHGVRLGYVEQELRDIKPGGLHG